MKTKKQIICSRDYAYIYIMHSRSMDLVRFSGPLGKGYYSKWDLQIS